MSSGNKRPFSGISQHKKDRPLTSFSLNNKLKFSNNEGKFFYYTESKNKEKVEELEVAFLIMKTSPIKYDLTLVNEKCKKLNSYFADKTKYQTNMSKTDSVYYKYNLLYGTKSNEIIKSYSPKMRPASASISNIK
jgi:hypothetical protein